MGPSRSCWNGTTSALKPEEITSKGTRVSCVYYQKVPIRKKSGNLFNDPRIFNFHIYIYIYIYHCILFGLITRVKNCRKCKALHMN